MMPTGFTCEINKEGGVAMFKSGQASVFSTAALLALNLNCLVLASDIKEAIFHLVRL